MTRPSLLINRERADAETVRIGRALLDAAVDRWLPQCSPEVAARIHAARAAGRLRAEIVTLFIDGMMPEEAMTGRRAGAACA